MDCRRCHHCSQYRYSMESDVDARVPYPNCRCTSRFTPTVGMNFR